MSHIANDIWNEHQAEISEEGNPFSFSNVLKIVGESTKRIYGINPYEVAVDSLRDDKLEEEANNAYQEIATR